MSVTTILNAAILDSENAPGLRDIFTSEGRIAEILPAGSKKPEGTVHDAEGRWAAPGYIDIHTHGGNGADIMDASPAALARVAEFHLSHGTTSFLATTLTAPFPAMQAAIDALRAYRSAEGREDGRYSLGVEAGRGNGARVVGIHMEGPFLSAANAGAQDRASLRGLDKAGLAFVLANADQVKRITLAPELASAPGFIRRLKAAGIGVSAGHDAAIDEEIEAAIVAGLDCVTHIYCCSSGISRREGPRKHLGLTEIGMSDDRLSVEVIADRRHTPDPLFSLIWKAKGRERICLVSDSIRIAGMPDGEYRLENLGSGGTIEKRGDEASIPSLGVYAGSVSPLAKMVSNIVGHNWITLKDAVYMATAVPARIAGLDDRGSLAVGRLADMNILDAQGQVLATFLGGEKV
jgi:N-acetylglucosamine-6-phosphate deacetylase